MIKNLGGRPRLRKNLKKTERITLYFTKAEFKKYEVFKIFLENEGGGVFRIL